METALVEKNFIALGREYKKDHLSQYESHELEDDAFKALDFFLSHAFMRGRRDKLSNEYYLFTINALRSYFKLDTKDGKNSFHNKLDLDFNTNKYNSGFIKKFKVGKKNALTTQGFKDSKIENDLVNLLTTDQAITINFLAEKQYKKVLCIQNDTDLYMVLDTLNFISRSEKHFNIYNYCNSMVSDGQLKSIYLELMTLNGVGDKIAAFFLRDIAILNDYAIDSESYKYIFPVDTWVAKIASKLSGSKFTADNQNEIKKYFIQNYPSDLKYVAAGIWYLGYNSLDFAIDYLLNYDIENK